MRREKVLLRKQIVSVQFFQPLDDVHCFMCNHLSLPADKRDFHWHHT